MSPSKWSCLLAVAMVLVVAPAVLADNWAVLVAGSNTYMNYRHQADVCHAYQILHKNGIPDSNIIVFMYDDIANDSQNPFKGTIVNEPNGPDVYAGVPKDYTGNAASDANFYAVLAGNASAVKGGSGKVLKSGPSDQVFIFYADHGGTGLVCMPDGSFLYAKDLVAALQNMHTNKQFGNLVFYMEACESGSMFDNVLPSNISVYASTASNPAESSYACYYDQARGTYLGDCYSNHWMENSDSVDIRKETISSQMQLDRTETNTSHVCEYGDLTIAKNFVSKFQSNGASTLPAPRVQKAAGVAAEPVDSRDVTLQVLRRRLADSTCPNERQTLESLIDIHTSRRATADKTFSAIARAMNYNFDAVKPSPDPSCGTAQAWDHDCIKAVVPQVEAACGRFSDYSLRYVRLFASACRDGVEQSKMVEAARSVCTTVY